MPDKPKKNDDAHNSGIFPQLTDKFQVPSISKQKIEASKHSTHQSQTPNTIPKKTKKRSKNTVDIENISIQHPDKIYKSSNSNLKWYLFAFILIGTIGYFIYEMMHDSKSRKRLPIENDTLEKLRENTSINKKTQPENITPDSKKTSSFRKIIKNSQNNRDELSHIDFDFSPIMSNKISRTPQLPERVKQSDDLSSTSSSELEALWSNGTTVDKAAIKQDYKKTAKDYLPPWRRYATPYAPTNGQAVFSVILEYDPQTMNINNLPQGKGYNVVIPGFLDYSSSISKALIEKGYEVLLYLPMGESVNKLNFKAITENSTFNDIRNSIKFHTNQLNGEGFVGFMNYGQDIKVNQSISKMNFTMSLLRNTGHLFVDNTSNQKSNSLAYAAATGQKVPTIKSEQYISSVVDQFPQFINKVKLEGHGVAVIKASMENVIALKNYQHGIDNEGIKRIPVSGILKHIMVKKNQ